MCEVETWNPAHISSSQLFRCQALPEGDAASHAVDASLAGADGSALRCWLSVRYCNLVDCEDGLGSVAVGARFWGQVGWFLEKPSTPEFSFESDVKLE